MKYIMEFEKEIMIDGFEAKHLEVSITDCRGDFNKMLNRFKKMVRKENIIGEYKSRQSFMSAGQKRRKAKSDGIYQTQKRDRKREEYLGDDE